MSSSTVPELVDRTERWSLRGWPSPPLPSPAPAGPPARLANHRKSGDVPCRVSGTFSAWQPPPKVRIEHTGPARRAGGCIVAQSAVRTTLFVLAGFIGKSITWLKVLSLIKYGTQGLDEISGEVCSLWN